MHTILKLTDKVQADLSTIKHIWKSLFEVKLVEEILSFSKDYLCGRQIP